MLKIITICFISQTFGGNSFIVDKTCFEQGLLLNPGLTELVYQGVTLNRACIKKMSIQSLQGEVVRNVKK